MGIRYFTESVGVSGRETNKKEHKYLIDISHTKTGMTTLHEVTYRGN